MTDQRYACPEIAALFTPQAQYDRWSRVLGAYHDANIRSVAGPDIASIQAAEAQNGHDVAAYLEWVRASTGRPELGAGLTSSNIVDGGLALLIRDVTKVLISGVDEACAELYALSSRHAKTPRLARTHGRAAEPDTLGRQAALWADRVWRASCMLADASREAGTTSFGGPAGDYSQTDRSAAFRAVQRLQLRLEIQSDQAVARDRVARWVQAVAAVQTAYAHVATQVRLGCRDGEFAEPTGVARYKGSSSMPHKRNPTRSERIVGIERVTRALAGAMAESVVWWDQRDITASSVERIVIPQICELVGYSATEVTKIVAGLEVRADVMAANLDAGIRHDGVGSAEVYATALKHGADPEDAYAEATARFNQYRGAQPCLVCGDESGGLHACR